MTTLSIGIIPWYKEGDEWYFFVGRPGGNNKAAENYYAYLKGGVENNEGYLDTALREFREESGVDLSQYAGKMQFLGIVKQRKGKNVGAWSLNISKDAIDPDECYSNLCEKGWPEIDKYQWMAWDDLRFVTHPAHIDFYEKIIYSEDLK